MPIEIKVGTPALTISQDRTFMVTNERGEIDSTSEQGLFAGDTRFVRLGRTPTRWYPSRAQLVTSYSNREFHRRCIYRLQEADSPPDYANGRVVFEVKLGPGQAWPTCAHYILVDGNKARQPLYTC